MAYLKFLLVSVAGLVLAACQAIPVPESGTAFLVRHAEKVTGDTALELDDPRDPSLTEMGEARAEALADRLSGDDITAIWSTDTTRTRDTAQPLADRLGLDVQIYDSSDLAGFAAQLKSSPGETVLVVGHSNTTPQLAEALGAEPGAAIVEKTEYDRLYVIDLATGFGEIERFGAPSEGQD